MYVGMHECDPISPIDNSHKFLPIVTTILSGGLLKIYFSKSITNFRVAKEITKNEQLTISSIFCVNDGPIFREFVRRHAVEGVAGVGRLVDGCVVLEISLNDAL